NTVGAARAGGIAGAASSTTAESIAKVVAGAKAAAVAATQLSNSATQVSSSANSFGLSAGMLGQLKATLGAMQSAASAQSKAAAQATSAMAGSCSSASALSGLDGAVASANTSASSLAGTMGQMLGGLAASPNRARMVGIMGVVSAGANASTRGLIDAVRTVAANTSDVRLLANLTALQTAATSNTSALALAAKAASAAQTYASGGSTSGVLADLAAAVSAASTFAANLGAAAGAAAAGTLTAQIALLGDPNLWTVTNGTAIRSPLSTTGFDSLSIASNGYTPLVSAPMASADIRAIAGPSLTKMSYALWIPTTAPNPKWVGATQMYVSSRSANVSNAYLGQIELTNLAVQTFLRPTFNVPAVVQSVLNGNYSDVVVTIVLNVNAGTQGWLVNDLHFGT
ncbi:MAG TPA: hypothetical protein VJ801_16180, partial [Polyangia bacterium]|nr:hypothetical protein [Polyangia bacterium]